MRSRSDNNTPSASVESPGGRDAGGATAIVWVVVGGQECGVEASSVLEIVPIAALSRPPGCPPILAGFLQLGFDSIPVIRGARLWRLPEEKDGLYTPVIVLKTLPHPMALLVDRVVQVAIVDNDERERLANVAAPGRDGPAFESQGRRACLLSCEQLLLDVEREAIAALRELEMARLAELEEAAA